jgi:cell division protein FtsN
LQPTAAPSPDTPSPSAPVSSLEKLTYADRLTTTTPPPETLKEPIPPNEPLLQEVKAVSKTPAPEPPRVAPPARTPKPAPANAAGGYVVQVAAVKERSEADTIAKRLASKGFPSFVSSPSAGAARVYRVRVGKYNDRREAESVARRLEKEEQFKPWITR